MADSDARSRSTLRTVLWLSAFFVIAVFLRSYFSAQVGYDPVGDRHYFTGNDPYFHHHTTEQVLETGRNVDYSPLINYPEGRDNPNPPLWTWTSALVASAFRALDIGGPDHVGSALNTMVAVWGALCILPIFMIARDLWGRRAGLWAAFFMAVSAPHIQRSVWGYADHDAISMFFILLAFAFIIRAFRAADLREHVAHWNRRSAVAQGLREAVRRNRTTLTYAALAGVSITACAIVWKGYPYVFGILAVAAFLQLVLDHLRNRDSTVTWLIYTIAIALGTILPWILYYQHQPWQMRSTVEPSLYVLYGVLALGLVLVPTRDLPSILVFPALLLGVILGGFFLAAFQPAVWHSITTGLGYFQQTKLYSTIAEAQRPELGEVAAGLGFFTFLLAFWGFFRTLRVGVRGDGPNILVASWSIVAMFMMFAAARFEVNAAPLFAVLVGYAMDRIVGWMGTEEVRKRFRSQHGQNPVSRSFRSLGWKPVLVGLGIAFFLVLPSAWLGVDAAIPFDYEVENGLLGKRDPQTGEYLSVPRFGAFGISFDDVSGRDKWGEAMLKLSTYDTCRSGGDRVCRPGDPDYRPPAERPGFLAWWDYGHWAVAIGDHPTVADPFQSHHELSGRVLASDTEEEMMEWLTILLIQGDRLLHRGEFSPELRALLERTDRDLLNMTGWYAENHRVLRGNLTGTDIFRFYDDVCEATGKCVGYFGVSSRMFPSREGGIFYAPVFLADKDPDEYIKTTIYANFPGLGQKQITEEQYEMVDGRSVRLAKPKYIDAEGNEYVEYQFYLYPKGRSPLQGYDPQSGASVTDQNRITAPTGKYYTSIFARAFGGPVLPGFKDANGHDQGQPSGDGLQHWRTIIETSTSEERDNQTIRFRGVAILAYYKGVTVNGTVLDDEGKPVPNVRVRFRDGHGAEHGSVSADEEGRFSLRAPFSVDNDITLEVLGGGGNVIHNETRSEYQFTLEQARRGGYGPDVTVTLQRGSIAGIVYEERTGNQTYEPGQDVPVGGAKVHIGGREVDTTGEDGRFLITDLQPNDYTLDARKWPEFANSTIKPVTVTSGGVPEVQIGLTVAPVTVRATFLDANGAPVPDVPMQFLGATGVPRTVPTNATGVATVELEPGTWKVSVEHNATVEDENGTLSPPVRYHATAEVVVERGSREVAVTVRQQA